MHKIGLIIRREFLSRVRKRSFLLATILTPLIFPAIMGILIYFAYQEQMDMERQTVMVLDESGLFQWTDTIRYEYIYLESNLETAKTAFSESEYMALLYIPKFNLENPSGLMLYSKKSPSLNTVSYFERIIEEKIEDLKLEKFAIDKATLASLEAVVSLQSVNLSETGQEKASSAWLAYAIGYAAGFLIYLFIFVYGSQVMQGVIEEKSSKIIEVIVSTVKPFQLMVGKVIGIAAVGLAQFLIWVVLIFVLSTVLLAAFGLEMPQQEAMDQMIQNMPNAGEAQNLLTKNAKIQEMMLLLRDVPYAYIIGTFIFYFLGGYLLYAALFAAVGSAVDSPGEAQQFLLPITIPLIAAIVGLFAFVLQDPSSNISFWLSMIPLTAPIAMMGRISFGVPWWELCLSMLLLIIGFLFTTWLASRIYRIGILMHGSKVNFKVMAKWLMMKG